MLKIGFASLLVLLCIGLEVAASENDTYTYTKDIGAAKDIEIIKVHFKNAFRGIDTDIATVDRIWQVSDTNPNLVIRDSSENVTLTTASPLKLEEGYQLAIIRIEERGGKTYVALSRNNQVFDSTAMMLPNALDIYNESIAEYYKAKDNGVLINIGYALIDMGKYNESLEVFERAIKIDQNSYVWNGKGEALNSLGKYNEALEAYNESIKIDPDNIRAWANKGVAFYNLGKYNESIEAYNNALDLGPSLEFVWSGKALDLYRLGKYNESLEAYGRDIELGPSLGENRISAAMWYDHGIALYNLSPRNPNPTSRIEMFCKAAEAFDKVTGLDPMNENAWYQKGCALIACGDFDLAVSAFEKAIELDPKNEKAWYKKGIALYNQEFFTGVVGSYDKAIAAFDKAIELDPKSENAWSWKGDALVELGRYDEAVKAYDKAIELNAKNEPELVWKKANALDKLGNYEDAIVCFNKASETNSVYSSMFSMGNEHLEKSDYAAAIMYYEEAIKQDQNNMYAWYNKGKALRMLHRHSEADDAFKKARELGYKGTVSLEEMSGLWK